MLRINNQTDLEINRTNLTAEYIESIKNSIKPYLFSSNSIIRENCCKCYSSLFTTITTDWPDGIDYLLSTFSDSKLLPDGIINTIFILRNIVNQFSFEKEIYRPFEAQFCSSFKFCIEILSKPPTDAQINPKLRTEIIQYINGLINKEPTILNDGENIAGHVPNLIESLSTSLEIIDDELFGNLLRTPLYNCF